MVEPSRGAEPATTEADRRRRPKLPRWRRILVGVLVVLVCLLVPISVVGVWVRNTILHTDQFVDTMAPLADDPAVQEAISIRVTNTLIEATDLEAKIADRLPDRAEGGGAVHRRRRRAGGARRHAADRRVRPVREPVGADAAARALAGRRRAPGQGNRQRHHEERRRSSCVSARWSSAWPPR